MASMGAPPAKKRRTEEQVSESSIAQANSTLQIFMGSNQRQNRWMHGYVPRPRDEEGPGQTQTPATPSTAVSGQQQHVQQGDAAGANQASATSPNLVQYESPVTSISLSGNAPPTHNNTARKSMHRVPSAGGPVGLPSPVSSEGASNSPATVVETTIPKRGRGRPPNITRSIVPNATSFLPSNGSPALRTQSQTPPPMPHQYQRGAQYVNPNSRPMHVPSNAGASVSPPMMQSPHAWSQQRQRRNGQPEVGSQSAQILLQQYNQQLLQRMDTFERNTMPNLKIGHVDYGRMSLLREAIQKNDWFYICLSQIHCLAQTPALLPTSVVKLPLEAFSYLDMLLCSNNKVNQRVHKWLSEFPTDIRVVYSSPSAFAYEQYMGEIVEFVKCMPLHWEKLVKDSRTRGAPPLMDDLLDKLALSSPVLQTTVFRAITRMIKEVSDPLEQLHRLDQAAFRHGRKRRTTSEKELAYNAFRITIERLVDHEQKWKDIQISQRAPFIIPDFALNVFRIGIPASWSMPGQGAPLTNHSNSTQHHPPTHLNNQNTSHNRDRPTGASGSPQQPGTCTTPAMVVYGGVLLPRQQHSQIRQLVFPHESEPPRAQPTHPDTMRSALHQAHLRSPILTPSKPDSTRLYRYVAQFALPPRRINKKLAVETITFDLDQDIYDALPATIPSEERGGHPSRTLTERSHSIRLRCATATGKALKTETGWMEADNHWPDNLYLKLNGHMLEQRRKLHHNRYLPIDLTTLVKSGHNELEVVVNRMSTDNRPYEYALAVEIISLTNHTAISDNIKHISSVDSLASIKSSLAGTDDDDDEIAITSSTATIQLFDPHTLTNIFRVPARGAACLHKDCFDLETFLSQRDPKNSPGTPSSVDCWRCPICRGDVRPHTLVRDGFLDSVRAELERKGMLDTRAILVEPDGSWKPKAEDVGGVRSPSLDREERGGSARSAAAPRVVEVIEID